TGLMPLTPVYGIQYPDRNTKLRQLGDELKQLALDIENALEQGAAPAPVDTGWQAVSLKSPFVDPHGSANSPEYRRVGTDVKLRGYMQRSDKSDIAFQDILCSIPENLAPSKYVQH